MLRKKTMRFGRRAKAKAHRHFLPFAVSYFSLLRRLKMTISSDIVIDCSILEKNRSKGEKSTSEVAKEYLSRIDNKTLTDLLEVYRVDFEMFQYSPKGYY